MKDNKDKITKNTGGIYSLTEIQKGIYIECMNEPTSLKYNIFALYSMPDAIDSARFISAVKEVINNHPVMNVRIGMHDGVPSMICGDFEPYIAEKTVNDIEEEKKAFLQLIDIENGPLYQAELCRTENGKVLFLNVHHLIFDGASVKTFINQIVNVYNGGKCSAEEKSIFDAAMAEQLPKDEKIRSEQLEFFREKFSDAECYPRLVSDIVADNGLTGTAELGMPLPDELNKERISEFTKRLNINENALYLGAFAYTLAKYGGTEDSFCATVHHGRSRVYASSFGMFAKTLPMYFKTDDKKPTAEFLTEVYNDYYKARCCSEVSFAELAEAYGVNIAITFIYQSDFFETVKTDVGEVLVDITDVEDGPSDIDFMVMDMGRECVLRMHYKKAVYSEGLVRSFAKAYINVLKSMLEAQTLGEIVITDAEDKKLLDSFNKTECPYGSGTTVVHLFREQVKKTPDNICLVYCNKRFTYKEVDNITDILAQNLRRLGIGAEKAVGVLIPRCEYMLICSLGVLKAGGAYMPLDPSYPYERLNLMMQDSGAAMLIYAPEYESVITGEFSGIRMSTDEIPNLKPCDIDLPEPKPEDMFVLLYTSGSTGVPKGVMFEHNNTLVTTQWVKKYFEIDETSKLTLYASYGFDAHAFDMYPAITSGAELHIISEEMRLDFPTLKKYYNDNGVTHTVMTTQVGRQFALMGGFTSLKHLSVAGEKLTPLEVPKGFNMYNLYGPTEASILISAFKMECLYKDVPIGKSVDNLKSYVVDKRGKLLPQGAVGELWISGPHVTRGYINRPEKTAEVYGTNTFDTDEGYERIYRTGDIVRFLGDGNLQYIGRRDAQVKIRGFRIELTEVEEVIRRFPGIKDATVAAFDNPSGGKYIAAYVVSDAEISSAEISDYIRSEKPPYMVPSVIMQIDKIPLNQNHKVDKRALPVPERKFENIVLPENDVQKKIFDIVSEITGHSEFGVDTDIYDAGLTSIGAIRLNMALAEAFDTQMKLSDIKSNSTVRKIEALLNTASCHTQYEMAEDYPISQLQNGIFAECMAEPESVIYNMPLLLKISDKIDTSRLVEALRNVINAHYYVKTTLFTDSEGNVRAKRNDADEPCVNVIKCDKLPDTEQLIRPYKLLKNRLYNVTVYETSGGKYLFMEFHHIVCDGESVNIILDDINKAYFGNVPEAEKFSGYEAALEEESVRTGSVREKAEVYWNDVLGCAETDCLPKKEPEAEFGTGTVKKSAKTEVDAVKSFCKKNKLTLNAFFNAVFAFVLSKFTGKESVTYSTIYNGRNDSRLLNTVALLVKTLPVAVNTDGNDSVINFVRSMKDQLMNSMSNDACSFAELSAKYSVKSDILFVYQGDEFLFDSLCGEKAEMQDVSLDAKAPVTVNVYIKDGHFEFVTEYRRNYYSEKFAYCLADSVDAAAGEFIKKEKLKDISLLTDYSEKLYDILNDTDTAVQNVLVHKLIERIAGSEPEAPAVIAAGERLSYGELNTLSNIMANALIKIGVGQITGLVLDRTKEVLIAELAVLKSGSAFLPMIPTYPDERIEFCLTNSESPYVITTAALKAEKPELFSDDKPYKTLTVEELLCGTETENPNVDISFGDLAYCIYTSGSTGMPKGVKINHGNFSNFVQTDALVLEYYKHEEYKGCALALSSISFDMSLYELYLPLCHGKCVCIATEDECHNPYALRLLMLENRVEMMVSTPSFMNNVMSIAEFVPALKYLKSLVVGAEAFPSSLYEALKREVEGLQIVNGYGPTECTICCSTKTLESGEGITIGRPTGNMKMFVLDKSGNILPPYGTGELIICGAGVGGGYIKLPEKTSASFFRLRNLSAYHSGDMVRLNGNSEIEFGGRIDNQVKLRGFRVELDEIENVIISFDSVLQSKVIVRNNGTEDYLAGFFTAEKTVDIDELTSYLKSRLTYYMVPAVLMQLEKMPLTPNGKIDKKALPEVKQTAKKKSGKTPKKSLEQRLCELFATVLGTDEVYADDNFFELGGTSLSASKITMILMSENIEIKYGDIFDNPTPELLAEFIESNSGKDLNKPETVEEIITDKTPEALKYNMVKYAKEVKREPLGNVLLTGAVGFLGIHILYELLQSEEGHIWCMVRRGKHKDAVTRLKTMLVYYFSRGFEEELRERITVIEADITDEKLGDVLSDIPFDTVINCAACVKHFSDNDILTQINVHGVENLISVCKSKNAKLVQISTVSVPGIHTEESYEKQIRMHENELFMIDDMNNKYIISKHQAEKIILDAIDSGMRAKIIRVGNLMGRQSDGEFQANMETNMFMSGIRGFAIMKKYPISHMTDPMSFSPVDCTARAAVLLAGTNDKFTAFNCDNRYGFDEMKIIDACNKNGLTIIPTPDEEYYEEFRQKLGDDEVNSALNGLAAYDVEGAHVVETDNLFTTNILYRIGFSWPLVDDAYLERAINSIMTLDYFNIEEFEEN